MTAQPVAPRHDDLLRYIAEAPDDGLRYEIDNGVLIVTPLANLSHQMLGRRVFRTIDANLPDDWLALYECGLTVAGRQLVPDLSVFDHEPGGSTELYPLIVPRLVVELESVTTRGRDRVAKTGWYAKGGVDAYWRIEADETVHVHTHPTPEGLWEKVSVIRPGEELAIVEPFPITLRSPIR